MQVVLLFKSAVEQLLCTAEDGNRFTHVCRFRLKASIGTQVPGWLPELVLSSRPPPQPDCAFSPALDFDQRVASLYLFSGRGLYRRGEGHQREGHGMGGSCVAAGIGTVRLPGGVSGPLCSAVCVHCHTPRKADTVGLAEGVVTQMAAFLL